MLNLSTILIELRDVIVETDSLIKGVEAIMQQGGPVLDIEQQRVRLFRLKRVERVLTKILRTNLEVERC